MSNKIVKTLENQFLPENRYHNFGPILLGLAIKGIKGINCNISFDFPITAISGYNGAGKSTIAQIALCMYRAPEEPVETKRKYLKDFFVKTLLDKSPYLQDAHIVARYASDSHQQTSLFDDESTAYSKTINVHYSTDRWAGYKHQPQKPVYYYGMSYFIPYQELNSNLLRDTNANVTNSIQFDNKIVKIVADILSIKYTALQNNAISNNKRTESVISANKSTTSCSENNITTSYSENHMGCGEGRLLKLVHALESAPEKSLFVIEEPETALHQLAQHKLSQYFLDVCNRKKHQIIFTTHSPDMQRDLPAQARKYIQRDKGGITSFVTSPSIAQIENYLSGGYVRKMVVVTEDEVAKLYIMEILRKYCRMVFDNCQFFDMNLGYKDIKDYVKKSQECGMKVYGVVDEKRRADIPNCILSFPDEEAPEKCILADEVTRKSILNEFDFDCNTFSDDHHKLFEKIAKRKNEDTDYVKNRCFKLYVESKGQDYFQEIISTMSEWLKNIDKPQKKKV